MAAREGNTNFYRTIIVERRSVSLLLLVACRQLNNRRQINSADECITLYDYQCLQKEFIKLGHYLGLSRSECVELVSNFHIFIQEDKSLMYSLINRKEIMDTYCDKAVGDVGYIRPITMTSKTMSSDAGTVCIENNDSTLCSADFEMVDESCLGLASSETVSSYEEVNSGFVMTSSCPLDEAENDTGSRKCKRKCVNRLSEIICTLQQAYKGETSKIDTVVETESMNDGEILDRRKCMFTRYVYLCQGRNNLVIKLHVCDKCGFESRRIGLFANHMKTEHNVIDGFECHECPYRSPSYSSYAGHRKTHKEAPGKFISTKLGPIDETVGMKIEHCPSTNYIYLYHYPSGITKKAHRCDQCEFEAAKISIFAKHMALHGVNDAYECHDCLFNCGDYEEYSKHMRQHQGQSCVTQRKGSLSKTSDIKYCEICGYKAKGTAMLEKHMQRHTGIKPFECRKCDYTTGTKQNLLCHMASRHQEGETETLCCEVEGCEFKTLYRNSYVRHMGLHNMSTSHVCKACGYVAKRLTEFRRHVKIHLGMKEFKCPFCDFMAYEQQTVRIHMVQHTNTPEFVCHICNVVKCSSFDLKRHLMSHEGLKSFKCSCCGNEFVDRAKTAKHIQNKHRGKGTVIKTKAHKLVKVQKKSSEFSEEVIRVNYGMRNRDDGHIEVFVDSEQKVSVKEVITLQCQDCPYASQSNNALVLHKLMEHTDCLKYLPPISDETRRVGKLEKIDTSVTEVEATDCGTVEECIESDIIDDIADNETVSADIQLVVSGIVNHGNV